jgi:transcription elongation factor Elf1
MSVKRTMLLTLGERQKQKYLDDPDHCPFCKSRNVGGGEIDLSDGRSLDRTFSCNECGKVWVEIFTLTGVEEVTR